MSGWVEKDLSTRGRDHYKHRHACWRGVVREVDPRGNVIKHRMRSMDRAVCEDFVKRWTGKVD